MGCLFGHNWGWPRKRGDQHTQVCVVCGAERVSKVAFDGPRYTRTQEAHLDIGQDGPLPRPARVLRMRWFRTAA